MDVRLPDGTIIKDVPEGTTKAQLVAKLKSNGYNIADEAQPQQSSLSRTDRVLFGMADPVQGGAQLLTKALPQGVVNAGNRLNNWLADKTGLVAKLPEGGVQQQTVEREAAYQAQRGPDQGFDGYRLLGNVASPVNIGLGLAAPTAATLGGRMAASAVTGASAGALSPVTEGDFATEKAKQVLLGGVTGGVTPAIGAGVGRVISPKASVSPEVALLKQEGVKSMTLGQVLGGRMNAAEEKLQSLPIVGDAIAKARTRALEDFNKAAINRATAPIGVKVDGVGQKAVAEAGDAIADAYDAALGSIKTVKFDGKFAQDFRQLKNMAQSLTPDMRNKFNKATRDVIGGRTSQVGGMTAETMKKVDSELGQMAARFGRSSVASEQELADALKQAQALLREQVARSSPQASKALKAADKAYANLVRVEGAAKAAKNNDGLFTPAQLNQAIQTADNSVRKRAVSRGTALMQDLGSAGQSVIGNRVPNSGTFDRAALGIGAMGGGYMLDPLIPMGLGAGALAYTPWLQRLLTASASSRPASAKAVAELLNKSTPVLGPAGGLLGIEMLKQ